MDAKRAIAQVFKEEGQFSYEVLLSIKGKFLIAQGIREEWAKARGIDPKLINYEFEDNITLLQAKSLGVLDFANDAIKTVEYKATEEETLTGEDDDPKGEYITGNAKAGLDES